MKSPSDIVIDGPCYSILQPGVIYGPSHRGKSTFAQALALMAAQGIQPTEATAYSPVDGGTLLREAVLTRQSWTFTAPAPLGALPFDSRTVSRPLN